MSGHHDVEKMIGVKPVDIILEGDSGGAHLSCAVSMILNDINKKISNQLINNEVDHDMKQLIKMPKALFGLFPAFDVRFCPSPSFSLTSIDPLATTSLMLTALKCFMPLKSKSFIQLIIKSDLI